MGQAHVDTGEDKKPDFLVDIINGWPQTETGRFDGTKNLYSIPSLLTVS